MQRQRVDSSSLESVGYDGGSHTLEVRFRNGGIYQYLQVPEDEVRHFLESDSMGRYLNLHIKESYPCRKVH